LKDAFRRLGSDRPIDGGEAGVYPANQDHPGFPELRSLVSKTSGIFIFFDLR